MSEDNVEQEREIMENNFCSLIVQAQNIIENCVYAQKLNDNSRNNGSSFDGNYFKWLEFRDTFRSMVNENESIHKLINFIIYGSCWKVVPQ